MKTTFCIGVSFLFFFLSVDFYGQELDVSGKVTDEKNIPIPGVTIMLRGTSTGTTTDFDGNYSVKANQGATLEFSYIGYKTEQVRVGDQTTINVVLTEDSQALDEVVVTAFGRQVTRNESTANVVSVSSEDLTKQKFTDATQALQGKVTGMTISSTSGTPGAAPRIRIRGMNSVTASNDPLYVIDGMPVNSGSIQEDMYHSSVDVFSLINPDDIESISVLKDASAVAPYGADGANGVILITTKSGKTGRTRFNLSMSGGFQNDAVRGPVRADAEQSYELFKEALWNSFGSGEFGNGQIASRNDLDTYAYDNYSQVRSWVDNGRPYADWYKETRNKDAFIGDVNFSVSQGNENSRFYGSLGFNKTEGTMLGSDFRRWSGKITYETNFNDKIKFKLSANVANVSQDFVREGSNLATFSNPNSIRYGSSPWAKIYNDDGSFNTTTFNETTSYANYPYIVQHDIRNNDITRAIPTGVLEYKILDNLTFRTTLGIDYTIRYFKNYNNRHGGDGISQNGKVEENALRDYHYTTQNSLDYNRTLGLHKFDVTLLQEFSKYKTNKLNGYGENFPNDELTNLSAVSQGLTTYSTYTDLMKMRYVGLLNYNYDLRYLANISYSYQGDSRFSDKYGNFYSVGLGWNLHKEAFMADSEIFDVLRLKLGYGLTGNAGIDRNQYQALLSFARYNSNPAGHITGYGTDATWEKSKRMDISADFELFDRRLRGSLGTYLNKTSDMLFNVPLSYTAQFTEGSAIRNVGEMENRGFEMSIGGDIISTPDFRWSADFNVSTFHNKVTELPEDAEIITERNVVQKGHKVHEWYLAQWAGVDPANGLPLWYVDKTVSDATTSNFSEAKRNYLGTSVVPDLTGSFSTRFSYKDLFLEAQFNYAAGHQVHDFRPDIVYRSTGSPAGYSLAVYEGAWRNPGDQTNYPRLDYNNSAVSNAGAGDSDRFIYDGDYIRLRDIGVGYTFKDLNWLNQLGVEAVSLSVRGNNMWTWVKDKDMKWDPEVVDIYAPRRRNYPTPPVKSVIFSMNVNF